MWVMVDHYEVTYNALLAFIIHYNEGCCTPPQQLVHKPLTTNTVRNGTEIEDTLVLNVFHVCEYIRDMV